MIIWTVAGGYMGKKIFRLAIKEVVENGRLEYPCLVVTHIIFQILQVKNQQK